MAAAACPPLAQEIRLSILNFIAKKIRRFGQIRQLPCQSAPADGLCGRLTSSGASNSQKIFFYGRETGRGRPRSSRGWYSSPPPHPSQFRSGFSLLVCGCSSRVPRTAFAWSEMPALPRCGNRAAKFPRLKGRDAPESHLRARQDRESSLLHLSPERMGASAHDSRSTCHDDGGKTAQASMLRLFRPQCRFAPELANHKKSFINLLFTGGPSETRTPDPLIKSRNR